MEVAIRTGMPGPGLYLRICCPPLRSSAQVSFPSGPGMTRGQEAHLTVGVRPLQVPRLLWSCSGRGPGWSWRDAPPPAHAARPAGHSAPILSHNPWDLCSRLTVLLHKLGGLCSTEPLQGPETGGPPGCSWSRGVSDPHSARPRHVGMAGREERRKPGQQGAGWGGASSCLSLPSCALGPPGTAA